VELSNIQRVLQVPVCKVIRFNIEYTIHYFEEEMIEVSLSVVALRCCNIQVSYK